MTVSGSGDIVREIHEDFQGEPAVNTIRIIPTRVRFSPHRHVMPWAPKIALAALAVTAAMNCSSPEGHRTVAVSILPQKYLAERIAGNRYRVAVLLPPGYSPESRELTPGRMRAASGAAIYFRVGPIPFERANMASLVQANPDMTVADTSAGIEPITGHGGHGDGPDPHLWVSLKSARIMAKHMMETLAAADPGSADYFRANYRGLIADIDRTDEVIARLLSPYRGRTFIVYHPAWSYFARDYGLVQAAVERDGKTPGPAGIAGIIQLAKREGARAVFIQSQFPSDTARSVAREIGGDVVPLDPLDPDYLGGMERTAAAIAKSLGEGHEKTD